MWCVRGWLWMASGMCEWVGGVRGMAVEVGGWCGV